MNLLPGIRNGAQASGIRQCRSDFCRHRGRVAAQIRRQGFGLLFPVACRRSGRCPPCPRQDSRRLWDFARELLACDLIMEVAPNSCVPRLVAECRALLEAEQTGDWTQTSGEPLAWLRLEMIARRNL